MWAAQSDEALLAGLEAGDADAATAFVRRFQARVYGLARTIARDEGLAEEISQEAFLRAWRHAGAYDRRRGQVTTWLLAITRNLAIDRVRVRRPEPIDPARLTPGMESFFGPSPPAAQPERGPAYEAVSRLPADQRRALLLAALFGYTGREVAEIEGTPLGTAKTRIRAALLKLREELEEHDEL